MAQVQVVAGIGTYLDFASFARQIMFLIRSLKIYILFYNKMYDYIISNNKTVCYAKFFIH